MCIVGRSEFDELLALWEEQKGEDKPKYIPLVPLKPPPGRLLFVGMNPSFNPKKICQNLINFPADPEIYFAWPSRQPFDPNYDLQLYLYGKENGEYFKQFKEIADALGVKWDHIDLFFWRETSQQKLRKLIFSKKSHAALTPFGQKQLKISLRLIEEAKPICIVVANALASNIYLHNRNPHFMPLRGCYEEDFGGRKVPLFFSSMLTGQRALDKHSRKRLVWHLGRELDKVVDFSKLCPPKPKT